MVEDVLVHGSKVRILLSPLVLILVVVEDVLVHKCVETIEEIPKCLNPCCGGRCSSTYRKVGFWYEYL